ncbi:receptor-type tyrosine-protein phosphatase F-like [Physella acuta]|uniref:receptor-type tyrosine-protein phosphatase F-like n=1 Tax=Physella acuta TaxID=109671 RepID=UPI0027DC2724|nr:receptor-type tyrosine-protein phosphatase F-like [Physella acuta]
MATAYTIRNLKPNTTYIFRVAAEHLLGRMWPIQPIEVTTGEPDGKTFLKFTKVPEDVTVSAGKNLRLECSADGWPTPNITWLDRFQKIDDVVVTPTGSVDLPLTNLRSSSVYTCMATSALWTIKRNVRVTVEVETVPKPPSNLRVVETSATSVTLSWEPQTANCSYMIVYKTWRKGRNPLHFDSFKSGIESTSFTITNLKPNTTYEFEVMASSHNGLSLSSKSVKVTTKGSDPPKFVITPNDVSILPGEDVNLTCSATGSPVPYVRWVEDGVQLTEHDNSTFGFSSLTLTDVRRSANYTCEAWSYHGKVEHHVQVTVKG